MHPLLTHLDTLTAARRSNHIRKHENDGIFKAYQEYDHTIQIRSAGSGNHGHRSFNDDGKGYLNQYDWRPFSA